jgi:hypothetical protein
MAVVCLSDEVVKLLVCPPERKHWEVFDALIKGLYVDVLPSGHMAFRLRFLDGLSKKSLTLGNARVVTVDEARGLARDRLRQSFVRDHPLTSLFLKAGPTVTDFFINQYLPYVKTYKRSWSTDESVIRNHVVPYFGALAMGGLKPPDLACFVQYLQDKHYAPGTVNRLLVLLRYGFSLALRWRVAGVDSNPVKEVKNLRDDNKIERFLTNEQMVSLMAAVRGSESEMLQHIVLFLLYTGGRKREVLDAVWADQWGPCSCWALCAISLRLWAKWATRSAPSGPGARSLPTPIRGCPMCLSFTAGMRRASGRACQTCGCMTCGTVLRRFWSTRGAACTRCKSCWAMPTSAPPAAMPI